MAAIYVGSLDGNQEATYLTLPVANSATVTEGDFVYFSSGRVTSASIAGARLIGVAESTVTGNAAGTNKVMVNVTPNARYIVDNDNDSTTFAASHVGTYFDLTGATGAQLVDTSTTGTSGQLLCLEYNPKIAPYGSDTSRGLFVIAEHALKI